MGISEIRKEKYGQSLLNELRTHKNPCELMEPDDELAKHKPDEMPSMVDEAAVMRNLFHLDDAQGTSRRQTYNSNVGEVTHKSMVYTCVGQGPN